ncbi:hypothetical protein ABPG74_019483 [Tetrahymena malaccensis]
MSTQKQQNNNLYLTEITEIPKYNVEEDEYFDYEKQYKQILKNKQKKSNIEYSSEGNRMPNISMRLLDEAINQNILPLEQRERLIRNPNKYSIFFCKFNCDSPNMKKAMQTKGIAQSDLNLKSFEDFCKEYTMSESMSQKTINTSINQNYLKKLIVYLQYVTKHYEKLKDLMNCRQNIKRSQKSQTLYSQNNNLQDSMQRLNQTQSEIANLNGSFAGRCNKSFVGLNKSIENSILTFDDRVKDQIKRAQKEEQALGKYVELCIDTKKQRELEYNRSLENLENRMKKNEQIEKIKLLKRQKEQQEKLQKVLERVKKIQEVKEEKIMNKFKRMDFMQERAIEKKLQLEKEREEFLKNNNNLDAKLLKIKEKQSIKEERIEEERHFLQKQIDEKQMKSTQLLQQVQNFHKERVERQKNKYNKTIECIEDKKRISDENVIQSLIQSHLDIQQKMQNKMKSLKKHYDERQKIEKKKSVAREKIRTELETKDERLKEKLAQKIEKHEEKIQAHKMSITERQQMMHDKLQDQIRRVQHNKSLVDLQNFDKQQKIIDKSIYISQQQFKKKQTLEQFKQSSRSLSQSLALKKQEILSNLI